MLLKGVLDHERARLQIVRRHAEGHWSLAKPKRVQGLLADKDVALIIVRRIERLDYLRNTLNKYAKAERAVPTAYVAPILAKLQTELSLLEDILETDLAPNESLGGQTVAGYTLWFFASTASSSTRRCATSSRRCGCSAAASPPSNTRRSSLPRAASSASSRGRPRKRRLTRASCDPEGLERSFLDHFEADNTPLSHLPCQAHKTPLASGIPIFGLSRQRIARRIAQNCAAAHRFA